MMPGIDPRKERTRKRARVAACIAAGAMTVSALVQPGWKWVPLVAGVGVIAVVTAIAMAAAGDLPRGRGTGRGRGSRSGRGRDDDGPAAAAHRWRLLVMVARLMPRPAGRRWLAEAESLLSEIAPARRGPAIRSYLLSAAGLAATMWARELQRRTRPGPRRPG